MSLLSFLKAFEALAPLWRWFKRTPAPQPAVLLVEDNADDAELVRRWLDQLGYRCDWQKTAEAALALMDKNGYKFCMIDLKLPMMSGIQLIRTLLDSRPYLRLIAVTGSLLERLPHSMTPLSEQLPTGEYIGLILKPVTKKALQRMLQN